MAGRRSVMLAIVLSCTTWMATEAGAEPVRRHGVYAEALGKGGLWGLGYDFRIDDRFSIGAVASVYSLEGQRVVVFSPYAAAYVARTGPHGWFLDLGPQLVHAWAPSPVPEWPGESSTGIGVQASSGYELRARVIFRVFVQGVAGQGGVVPWMGTGVGWAF